MEKSQAQFRIYVQDCLKKAEELYGLSFGRVTVTFDLKGTAAAKAGIRRRKGGHKAYSLRFNKEAIALDWEMMVNSTIAHEVAHLVAFAAPELRADGHNRVWKMIAISLGDRDKGSTCHTLPLTPIRKKITFVYRIDDGADIIVSGTVHKNIQKGLRSYACRITKKQILPEHYQGYRS